MTDEKKIDALIEEAMSQVQVFASAWSMVGGPFDYGDCLENAEVEKHATRALFRDLVNTAIGEAARAGSVLTDEQILALNAGEVFFSESPTRYPEAGHGTQYHAGAPGVIKFARAVITLLAASAK